MLTQCDMILRHLQDYGQITTMDAFVDYGITRLSGRIWDLRHAGHSITSTTTAGKNRYGEVTHYTTYRLEGLVNPSKIPAHCEDCGAKMDANA